MHQMLNSLSMLLLRVVFGGIMLTAHGLPKLTSFGKGGGPFADPLGVGSATSLLLAIFAEFFCSILVFLGLGTRLACIPLIITMLVACVGVHGADSLLAKEKSILYMAAFTAILINGPGTFSFDQFFWGWMKKRRAKKAA